MKNLQSKQMPFRTNNRFYEPTFKEKAIESIKVFPEKLQNGKETIVAEKQASTSFLKYISELNDAKHLPRKVGNKDLFYPVVKICKRRRAKNYSNYKIDQHVQNIELQNQRNSKQLRFQTLCSNNPSNRSIVVHSFINEEEKKIDQEKEEFRKTKSLLKDQKTKQMRFSFYNTLQKSEFFLKKFKEDAHLSERRTNNFQNMFKRTITSENILNFLNRSRQKLKLGVLQ